MIWTIVPDKPEESFSRWQVSYLSFWVSVRVLQHRGRQSHVFMMWMLHALLYTFLYNLRSVCCHGCPEKCVCEAAAASVQCFRVQSIPSGIPGDVRKLNLGYNHIKEMKVMLNIWHLVTDLFYFGFSIKCLPDSEACSWSHKRLCRRCLW